MDVVFLVGACVLVIAFVLSLMLKEVPLRTMSGLEAARAEEAAVVDAARDPVGATHRERDEATSAAKSSGG